MGYFTFAEETKDMTAAEILNYYRNLYYAEPQVTEHGIVANAINDILVKNAELESQVVRMQYHDDQITQRRVFEIEFSKFLDPEEAMDIFIRNVKRIFERNADNGR